MIAHPPCTFLAVSGARWMKDRPEKVEAALEFVRPVMASKDGGAAVQGMLEGLANIRHDSCFGSTLELAKDAASEARVVQMRRPRP